MSRYWIYMNDQVVGPYEIDDLIRKRGFSRESRVCLEQPDGRPGEWMSAVNIPELAKIFQAADKLNKPDPVLPPKPASKPKVAKPAFKPIEPPKEIPSSSKKKWAGIFALILLVAFGAASFLKWKAQKARSLQLATAREMVLREPFPSDSPYRNAVAYLDEKKIRPRWDMEFENEGITKVTMSWYDDQSVTRSHVLAFRTNEKAMLVQALNSAAQDWLEYGPTGKIKKASAEAASKSSPKPSQDQVFQAAVESRRNAIENADFSAVWSFFTHRKQSEMIQAGMSETGFVQLQKLRNKVDDSTRQILLKTVKQSPKERWVLIKESHASHGDTFLKQRWLFEDNEWRMDDEEKRLKTEHSPSETNATEVNDPSPATETTSNSVSEEPSKKSRTIPVQSLPGLTTP